jgi:N-acetylmuramoyl-L-alanine amidase
MKIFYFLSFFTVIILLGGCSGGNHDVIEPDYSVGKSFAPAGVVLVSSDGKVLEGSSGGHSLKFRAGSAGVYIDGIPLIMPDAAVLSPENVWDISAVSASAFISPVVKKVQPEIRRILIDPGHGGRDNGAVSVHRVKEKDLNLLLAHSVANELRRAGFEVFLTRSDDRYLTLDERPEMIRRYQADLFVSIHHNSAGNPGAAGLEIFVLNPQTPEEENLTARSIYTAFLLYKDLYPANTFPGRGVKAARFKVLRQASCPAILVEAGFLSHPAESALLGTPYFRREFAVRFASALRKTAAGQSSETVSPAARKPEISSGRPGPEI